MSERQHSSIGIHPVDAGVRPMFSGRHSAYAKARVAALLVLVLLLTGGALTVGIRRAHSNALEQQTADSARVFVTTATATGGTDTEALVQPGTLQGFVESPIYARTNGYVLRWVHDIGAHVRKGDLLAELDTPEVDQQLAQAVAAEDQARANLDLTKISAARWEHLRQSDAVSQQELDERRSALVQAEANLASAQANTHRLRDLESFKRVVAPFDGIVTRRNIDIGDLVDAGSNGGNAKALFLLSQSSMLRVYVYVPQFYANRIRAGQSAEVTQAELPGRRFAARVAHIAGAIDAVTRTMQVEIQLPNPGGELLPGAYVDVHLPGAVTANVVIPSNALLFRGQSTQLAVVDDSARDRAHAVHLQPVQVGRDFGQTLELIDGIREGQHIVLNPPDSLVEGDLVWVREPVDSASHASGKPRS